MKLRKLSKNDVAHLRFQVCYDFDFKAFRMDDVSKGLSFLVPYNLYVLDPPSIECPPYCWYEGRDDGFVFSHAVFHRFSDGRLDVEYVYIQDLLDQDVDNIVIPSCSRLLLENQLQSVNFQGYYKKVFEILRMIQRYE